jgi:3-phenylpropionate/trans-cinnamate dioxygenase ferredoxin reductase subunit
VVGAGLAGLRTVERLRQRGFTGRITLIGAEPHLPYDRPPLSKQVLRGEEHSLHLLPEDAYAGLDTEILLGERAFELDTAGRRIRVTDGWQPYDVLVIATGATPRRIPGVDGLLLRTLDEARHLQGKLLPSSRLAVVGAGLIGCEVAASARALDVTVHLVDVLSGPMIRVVGSQVCEVVASLHREHGVQLHMGTGVRGADPAAGRLTLSDGTELEADVVLEAIGAAPETGWLEGSGLSLDDGVVCDATGRAADDVYAVGDVARWAGRRVEHWTNAGEQADQVAAAIVGEEPVPAGPAYWWSDQYDMKIQGLGSPGPDDEVHVLSWGPKARTVAVYAREGRLTGVVGFSAAAAVMRMRPDIMAGTPVTDILARLSA